MYCNFIKFVNTKLLAVKLKNTLLLNLNTVQNKFQ